MCVSLCQCEMFTAGLSVWYLFGLWSVSLHALLREASQTQTQFVKQICYFSQIKENCLPLRVFGLRQVWSMVYINHADS